MKHHNTDKCYHHLHNFCYLYYYSRRVFTLPSSKFDENLPARSQFYSDHPVNLSTLTYCQSATFGPLAFCVCPLFFTTKIIINFTTFCYAVFTLIARWRHHRLLKPAHDNPAQLSTMFDFIVLSIKLVFMVLGVSYSRVLAQRPTGCCSASKYLLCISIYYYKVF